MNNEIETRKVVLWEIHQTDKAILCRDHDGKKYWIPKSRIKHISREAPDQEGIRKVVIEAEEWLLEKNGL